jgi:hypothetical protein
MLLVSEIKNFGSWFVHLDMLIVVVTRRTVNALGYAGAEEMVLYTPS